MAAERAAVAAEHPGYWTPLLEHNPTRAERKPMRRQWQRDERRRQALLANNSPAIRQVIADGDGVLSRPRSVEPE